MNITVTDQEHCKKQIQIEIPSNTVREEIERKATKYARQMSIPGFRPGKAPVSVIKTRFHKELRDEVMSELLPTTFDNAIKENSLKVVSEPHVHDMKYGDDDSLSATFVFEVAPEFELPDYKKLSLTKTVRKTTDEDVDKAIEMLREGRAELAPVEDRGAQAGDTVTVMLSGKADPDYVPEESAPEESTPEAPAEDAAEATDEESAAAKTTSEDTSKAAVSEKEVAAAESEAKSPDAITDNAAAAKEEEKAELPSEVQEESVDLQLGAEGTLKEFDEGLAGLRPGDKKTITVTYPKTYPDPAYANRRWHFDVEVSAVRAKELPPLDEEFIAGLDENLKSADELRERIRSNFEKRNTFLSEEGLRDRAIQALVEANRFEVPEQMVEKQMQQRFNDTVNRLVSSGIDVRGLQLDWKAMIESHREQARDDVRGFFLLDRIAEAENIEVTDDDVDEEVERMAEASGQSVSLLMARLTRENALDTIRGQIRHQKALDFVINSADIKEEEAKEEEAHDSNDSDDSESETESRGDENPAEG